MTPATAKHGGWQAWLRWWDHQQAGYMSDREGRFAVMLDAVEAVVGHEFVALDLMCGPGALSQRILTRFPQARVRRWTLDPVTLARLRRWLPD